MILTGLKSAAKDGEASPNSLIIQGYGNSTNTSRRIPSDWVRAMNVLSKEWRSAALFAVGVFVLVTVVTFLIRPVYESEGRLEIDPPGSEVFSLDAAGAGLIDSEYVNTEAQKLQTDDLALATIRALHLDANPEIAGRASNRLLSDKSGDFNSRENAVVRSFQSKLSIRRDPSSRLVSVSFASHNPQLSADVVNSLMGLLVERNFESRNRAITESSVWLSRQLDDIREKMEGAMRTLADFGERTGIADLDPSSNTYAEKMGDLNRQMVLAQSERIQYESFLSSSADPESLPQVRNSLVVQALTQKLAEQNAQLAQSRVVYGPSHAEVRKLQNQVNELQSEIKAQRGAIVSELWTNYHAAQARERLLESKVKTATTDLTTLAQYNVLKKEAEVDRDLYDRLYAKIKEAGIAAASKSSNVHVVNQARVLDHPTRPRRGLTIMSGALMGIIGGIALAFLKDRIQDRVHTIDDLREWEGLPTIMAMPAIHALRKEKRSDLRLSRGVAMENTGSRCFLQDRPNTPESEAVVSLRTVLFLSEAVTQPKVVLVTSPLPSEGKTTVANNLAIALSKYGTTCLVDADMRMPTVGPSFHVAQELGLAHYLQGTASLDQVLCPLSDIDNLTILPSPMPAESANYLLTGKAIRQLIESLRSRFDFVVIDTPPILPYTDGLSLATMVDGVILIGRAGQTPRGAISRGMELLETVKSARILTVVLNDADVHGGYRSYSY